MHKSIAQSDALDGRGTLLYSTKQTIKSARHVPKKKSAADQAANKQIKK